MDDQKRLKSTKTIFDYLSPFKLTELSPTLYDNLELQTPKQYFNIELFPHQLKLARAITDMENKRFFTSRSRDVIRGLRQNEQIVFETNALIISDAVGSGKTFIILMVIAANKIPMAVPLSRYDCNVQSNPPLTPTFLTTYMLETPNLIKPNLIIVGSSVLAQWEMTINKYTKFSCFVIGDVRGLDAFQKKYRDNTINTYDIVLLKNGNVTGNFRLIEQNQDKISSTYNLIERISTITKNSIWSRVIYDDFDVIEIPVSIRAINCLFTIYVSSTKLGSHRDSNSEGEVDYFEYLANKATPKIRNSIYDELLFTTFNFRNNKAYVEDSLKIPIYNVFRYVYNNPNDQVIGLIGAMDNEGAARIMEMLNGDAIETAAAEVGVASFSIGDIFQKILDNEYTEYINALTIKKHAESIMEENDDKEEHPNGDYSHERIMAVVKEIRKNKPVEFEYFSHELRNELAIIINDQAKPMAKAKLALDRVKSNLEEGGCLVCAIPLVGQSIAMAKCCNVVVCGMCLSRAFHLNRTERGRDKSIISGMCPKCRSIVNLAKDIIIIDRNFDIESLIDKDTETKLITQEKTKEEVKTIAISKAPKLDAIVEIIRGNAPASRTTASNQQFSRLLTGKHNIPIPKNTKRKVLIFANYTETTNKISEFLTSIGEKFLILAGTYHQIHDTAEEFKTRQDITTLIINSSHTCAGINLQFATDVVFFHKIIDENIENQVAGRAQRIGRKFNLDIHYLLYNNESAANKEKCI